MLKKFFAFSALIAILNFTVAIFTATNFNVAYAETDTKGKSDSVSASVVDTQNRLKPDEINSLTQKINAVEQKYNVKIGIEFLKNTHGQSVEATANSLLNKNFRGGADGSILLLVVMDSRKWQISIDGEMQDRIFDTDSIAAGFLDKLSSGDYYGACNSYIDGVEKSLAYYEQNGSAYDSSDSFDFLSLIIAFVLAIFCGVMFRSMLIGSMSNVRVASEAGEYLDKNSVNIEEKKDRYLFTNVSRRPKNKGRSGGGGGGGSHGGSGGSF